MSLYRRKLKNRLLELRENPCGCSVTGDLVLSQYKVACDTATPRFWRAPKADSSAFFGMIAAIQGLPESPNLITLIYRRFEDQAWAIFLNHWQSVFFSFLVAALLSLIFYLGSRRLEMIPRGVQNFLESLVEVLKDAAVSVLGEREGEKYFPLLASQFIYILSMNLIGFIPLMKAPSSSLNITVAMAICVFVFVQYLNIRNMGFIGFLHHLAGSPKTLPEWLMAILLFPLELLTQLSRPFTLALRLFGNILGEKILVTFFVLVSIGLYFFPVQTPFLFLGLLMAVMQAAVFTLLSAVYIHLSVPHEEEVFH